MPTAYLVARFIRTYGAALYLGPWATPDRTIPARLFYLLFHQIPALQAGERLEMAEAGRLAQLLVEAPQKEMATVKREARRLARLAVPLIYPPSKE